MLTLVIGAGPQVQHPASKRRRSELASMLLHPPTGAHAAHARMLEAAGQRMVTSDFQYSPATPEACAHDTNAAGPMRCRVDSSKVMLIQCLMLRGY